MGKDAKKELHGLGDDEIKVDLARQRARLFELRVKAVTEKIEDNSQVAKVRKEIARLLTERRARQIKRAAAKA